MYIMATQISDEDDFISWISSGTTGELTNDIVLSTGKSYPYVLADNSVLDGKRYKITLASDMNDGIFDMADNRSIEIREIMFDAGNISSNIISHSGIIFAYLNNSGSNMTGLDITITNCGCVGSPPMGSGSNGSFIGNGWFIATSTITITGCYSVVPIASFAGGGIVGPNVGRGGTQVVITECYSTGTISGQYAGGITGSGFGVGNTVTGNAIVKNCYSTGNVTGQDAGGVVGYRCGENDGIFVIGNCYNFW